jgi:low affinity Fe/Cu permease
MTDFIYRKSIFSRFASSVARTMGHPAAFATALLVILGWALSGPVFGFSDTWQLVINTGTTIVTFLMVFLIQNSQNRDSEAMHLKLDELIRAVEGAHNALLNLEDLTEQDLDRIRERYSELAKSAREGLKKGQKDTDCPEINAT